jgi:hypothetical protein
MGKSNYVCTLCRKDFSRKSNANRHNFSQHQGLAEIISVGDHKLREKGIFAKENSNSNTFLYHDRKKARLIDILEKLVPRFEEMEKVLSYSNSEGKQDIWARAIMHAISSPDPIRSMTRSLDAIRKGGSVRRMIDSVASSLGVSRTNAEEILENMLFRPKGEVYF